MSESPELGWLPTRRLHDLAKPVGQFLTEGFHLIGLFAIGASTVWAAARAFIDMVARGTARLEDLLLLFIYLEIGSMVGIYFRTNRMPVLFLIYVGLTALTRHMIVFVQTEETPGWPILILTSGALMLAIAGLIIRYGSSRFGSSKSMEWDEDA